MNSFCIYFYRCWKDKMGRKYFLNFKVLYKCVLMIINVVYKSFCKCFCLLFMLFIFVIIIIILFDIKVFFLKE